MQLDPTVGMLLFNNKTDFSGEKNTILCVTIEILIKCVKKDD